jgi:hypothetical protein
MGEIEPAGEHFLGEALGIADLLARQPGRAQRLVAGRGDLRRIGGAAGRGVDPRPDRRRRLDADLLADDRAQQGFVAARADARLRIADLRERDGESGFDRAESIERGIELFGVQGDLLSRACASASRLA